MYSVFAWSFPTQQHHFSYNIIHYDNNESKTSIDSVILSQCYFVSGASFSLGLNMVVVPRMARQSPLHISHHFVEIKHVTTRHDYRSQDIRTMPEASTTWTMFTRHSEAKSNCVGPVTSAHVNGI